MLIHPLKVLFQFLSKPFSHSMSLDMLIKNYYNVLALCNLHQHALLQCNTGIHRKSIIQEVLWMNLVQNLAIFLRISFTTYQSQKLSNNKSLNILLGSNRKSEILYSQCYKPLLNSINLWIQVAQCWALTGINIGIFVIL